MPGLLRPPHRLHDLGRRGLAASRLAEFRDEGQAAPLGLRLSVDIERLEGRRLGPGGPEFAGIPGDQWTGIGESDARLDRPPSFPGNDMDVMGTAVSKSSVERFNPASEGVVEPPCAGGTAVVLPLPFFI
jgi:hypothetical protein